MIVLITPTADRPHGIALCEKWMARQTVQWDRWIVADGGQEKCNPTLGQEHVHVAPQPRGFGSLCANVLAAVDAVGTLDADDVALVIEDDDYYLPTHIEQAVTNIRAGVMLTGPRWLYYYNVRLRGWMKMDRNRASAPLCGTALRGDALLRLAAAARLCQRTHSHNVDGALWRMPLTRRLHEDPRVVGIKGLPGRVGLGIGHDPRRNWNADRDSVKLRELLGADVRWYAPDSETEQGAGHEGGIDCDRGIGGGFMHCACGQSVPG